MSGAGRGIGRAIVERALTEGAAVAFFARGHCRVDAAQYNLALVPIESIHRMCIEGERLSCSGAIFTLGVDW